MKDKKIVWLKVYSCLEDESGTLCLLVTTQFKVLASLESHVWSVLARRALQSQHYLFCGWKSNNYYEQRFSRWCTTNQTTHSWLSCGRRALSDHHNPFAWHHNDAFLEHIEKPFRSCIEWLCEGCIRWKWIGCQPDCFIHHWMSPPLPIQPYSDVSLIPFSPLPGFLAQAAIIISC